jgi:hypothetical protein
MIRPLGPPPAVIAIFQAPPPDPGVGVVPPAALAFPLHSDSSITSFEIGYLCMWYNEDMGIIAGDNAQTMRNKLRAFLTGNY